MVLRWPLRRTAYVLWLRGDGCCFAWCEEQPQVLRLPLATQDDGSFGDANKKQAWSCVGRSGGRLVCHGCGVMAVVSLGAKSNRRSFGSRWPLRMTAVLGMRTKNKHGPALAAQEDGFCFMAAG